MQKHRLAWGAFVAFGVLHLTALYWDFELLRRLSKLVLIPLLLLVYITSSNAKPKKALVLALIFLLRGYCFWEQVVIFFSLELQPF